MKPLIDDDEQMDKPDPETVNGYVLEAPFHNKDAGFSRWTFADKDGVRYFIKEFLSPVYPSDTELSSEIVKFKINECSEYMNNRLSVYRRLNEVSDGHLVRIAEFFRHNSHFYITTECIQSAGMTMEEISQASIEDKMILLRGFAHGMQMLHQASIVHADIKETNVLIRRTSSGRLSAKVIDYDCAFFEGSEISQEDLGGDLVYLSPEACRFLLDEPVSLTCKMDIFAMGLLFHQYLSGKMPDFDEEEYDYAHVAVLEEQELKLSEQIPADLRILIGRMLVCDPEKRCSAKEVYDELGRILSLNEKLSKSQQDNGRLAEVMYDNDRTEATGKEIEKTESKPDEIIRGLNDDWKKRDEKSVANQEIDTGEDAILLYIDKNLITGKISPGTDRNMAERRTADEEGEKYFWRSAGDLDMNSADKSRHHDTGTTGVKKENGREIAKGIIEVYEYGEKKKAYKLNPNQWNKIGRNDEKNDILITSDISSVSRQHCRICCLVDQGEYLVKDLSTNGTWFSEGTKLVKGVPARVRPGTIIWLGSKDCQLALL